MDRPWHRHVSRRCPNFRKLGDTHDPCLDCFSIESFWRSIPYEPNSEVVVSERALPGFEAGRKACNYGYARDVLDMD